MVVPTTGETTSPHERTTVADQELVQKLRNVHAVNVTPFQEDGTIDYLGLEENVRFLLDNGAEVIVPCGNTGEFYALTVEEAQAVARFVAEKVDGRAMVLAGVGHDLKTAREMALSAQDAGADAVMVHQPAHPHLMAEGLIRYYTRIACALHIGVALYVRHPAVDRDVLDRVTALDNVVAVKYAVNDLPTFATIAQSVTHSVAWICGTAELWAPFFFAAGAEGFTSGLVNIAPERSLAMLAALRQRDRRSIMCVWKEIAPLERLRASHHSGNNVTVIKEAMNLLGLPGGYVREPVGELNEADRQELVRILKTWNKL
jgi:4-hydroxy-tetrahydrodipicolinate synthase